MTMKFLLVFSLLFSASLAPNTTANSTDTDTECPINIPGFPHHGNCDLLCRPAECTDIVLFYFGNYVAHAATVTSSPGQSLARSAASIFHALLFPSGGIFGALRAIRSLAKFGKTDLQKAARAGALCAVVKIRAKRLSPREKDRIIEDANLLDSLRPKKGKLSCVS
jgi:hypothetical protein